MMMCLIWPHLSRPDDMQLELTCQCDESVLDGLKRKSAHNVAANTRRAKLN